jgi:hypothetical protein
MTYVEIFGKEVSNLLAEPEAESRTVGAWAGVAAKTVLEGRCAVQINDEKSVAALLRLAESRKRTSATEMNERSTRAHSLLLLDLEQTCKDSEMVVRSTLCFADLGGFVASPFACCAPSFIHGYIRRLYLRHNDLLLLILRCLSSAQVGTNQEVRGDGCGEGRSGSNQFGPPRTEEVYPGTEH